MLGVPLEARARIFPVPNDDAPVPELHSKRMEKIIRRTEVNYEEVFKVRTRGERLPGQFQKLGVTTFASALKFPTSLRDSLLAYLEEPLPFVKVTSRPRL